MPNEHIHKFFAKSLSAVCWFATSGGDIGFSLICGFSLSIVCRPVPLLSDGPQKIELLLI